jgi:hypothetical protein
MAVKPPALVAYRIPFEVTDHLDAEALDRHRPAVAVARRWSSGFRHPLVM